MGVLLEKLSHFGVLFALIVIIGISGWIGVVAQRAVSKGSFLKGFFLGNRGLGVWAMALTATVQSGGTFMGVPSLIYKNGFIVALWIGSYMLVPLTGFAVVGKRLSHLSRRTNAVTVPDLFRNRFESPMLGLVTSIVLLFFLSFMLMAQFKGGAIVMKLAWPSNAEMALTDGSEPAPTEKPEAGKTSVEKEVDYQYLIGLAVFTSVVVGYTLFGGFLASVWTDMFQSVLMAIGVVILLTLSLKAAGGLEQATHKAVAKIDAEAAAKKLEESTADDKPGVSFVTGPGLSDVPFLPLGTAISFFFVWIWGGISSPASVVRVMSAKSTATLRRSIVVLSFYNLMIYLPLIAVCICARAILPTLTNTDEVVPKMSIELTREIFGGSFVSGLILAAPFGAIMATVSCYLVVIASGIVHDIYQRFINPEATEKQIRNMTHAAMLVIGVVALAANIKPPNFLQSLVVFCTSGQTGGFLIPLLMACYWRRATKEGVIAAMASGALTVLALNVAGWILYGYFAFRPYQLLGVEPVVWGILVSAIIGVVVTLQTPPPDEDLVRRMFDVETPTPKGTSVEPATAR